jgi:hypothetical protein
LTVTAPTVIPAWSGLLHVVHNSINADVITLPAAGPRAARGGADRHPQGHGRADARGRRGDTIAVNLAVEQVNRSVTVFNNGDAWALTGV